VTTESLNGGRDRYASIMREVDRFAWAWKWLIPGITLAMATGWFAVPATRWALETAVKELKGEIQVLREGSELRHASLVAEMRSRTDALNAQTAAIMARVERGEIAETADKIWQARVEEKIIRLDERVSSASELRKKRAPHVEPGKGFRSPPTN
jgi:hypothetical protein